MTWLGLLWLFTVWFGLAIVAAGVYVGLRWWVSR